MENAKPCIFCDIIQKKSESYLIAEDKVFVVILDIFPLRPGHVLIISKRHVKVIEELDDEERGLLIMWVNKMCKSLKSSPLKAKATQVLLNNGKEANQTIPHLHFHIIPRYGWDLGFVLLNFLTRFFNPFFRIKRARRLNRIKEEIKSSLI
ncbi:HIT family protein [Bacteriovoracales bacterium]|nr:HIT family protein [Bacteriovoracales bacterium]